LQLSKERNKKKGKREKRERGERAFSRDSVHARLNVHSRSIKGRSKSTTNWKQ